MFIQLGKRFEHKVFWCLLSIEALDILINLWITWVAFALNTSNTSSFLHKSKTGYMPWKWSAHLVSYCFDDCTWERYLHRADVRVPNFCHRNKVSLNPC